MNRAGAAAFAAAELVHMAQRIADLIDRYAADDSAFAKQLVIAGAAISNAKIVLALPGALRLRPQGRYGAPKGGYRAKRG